MWEEVLGQFYIFKKKVNQGGVFLFFCFFQICNNVIKILEKFSSQPTKLVKFSLRTTYTLFSQTFPNFFVEKIH
jgi:hypothetical protein